MKFILVIRYIIPILSIISTFAFIILKIVLKKKIFFIGIFGSLGIGIISFVVSIFIQIGLFFLMGLLRPISPLMAKYELNVQRYTYKTTIENKPHYNHTDTKIEEDICEFDYGFVMNPYYTKATVNNELVARTGPPFGFDLDFDKLSHDVESIYIKKAEIISNDGARDLFDYCVISIEIYNIFWDKPTLKKSFLNNFIKERTLNIDNLYEPMRKTANKQKRYNSKEELEDDINNTNTLLRMNFKYAPINVLTDDIIQVNIEMLFYKNDGEIKNITLNNTYYREHFEETVKSTTPLEKLPTENETKK
ncbi:hypothetical protein FACS1894110_22150 [Spirochaetia bacterium]|nr:hypothetical protein FACS1894110_22150 [Spirochaetia bacterium]